MRAKVMLAALAVAAVLPASALADQAAPSDKANGARACQALRTSLGAATFKATYGANADKSNAFGRCVSRWTQAEHRNRHEAEAACKANLPEAKPGELQRCIQAKRKAASARGRSAVENAARTCKAERKASGDAAFRARYGTNADKSNAFGRCVSKLAQAQQQ